MDEFNSSLDKAKEGISELEGWSEENIETEKLNKRMGNTEKNIREKFF